MKDGTCCEKPNKAMLGLLLGLGMLGGQALAAEREFDMTIEEVTLTVAPSLDYKVFGFNAQVPGPLIHVEEGDDVIVNVMNNSSLPHTIHWHGIHQKGSWRHDGVPGVTQKLIDAGESFTYKFKADRIGSIWYQI